MAFEQPVTLAEAMKKNTRVSWQVAGLLHRGSGVVISDEENGKVLVAVDHMGGEPNPGYHPVICCTVTWLTVETSTVTQ